MEFSLGGAQELWANLLCALDPKGLSASSAASRRAAEPRGGGGSVREKREGGRAVAEGSGVSTAESSGPESRYQPGYRSAPGGVSTADSGGGGPRRMTLHLAGEVFSARSLGSGGPVSTVDSASRLRGRSSPPVLRARLRLPPFL
ncbi:unnamed protein product [Rangifer tarandus platyrhynchus]|uniref:Uncharacterized protein n=1 Tax=Rangifer tarandus platyrhynchus TaxID=3082113 RepID=A0AC59ZVX9_RANTA